MSSTEKPLPEKPLPSTPDKPLPETPLPDSPTDATADGTHSNHSATVDSDDNNDQETSNQATSASEPQARFRSFNVRRKPLVQLAPPEANQAASSATTEQTTPATSMFNEPTNDDDDDVPAAPLDLVTTIEGGATGEDAQVGGDNDDDGAAVPADVAWTGGDLSEMASDLDIGPQGPMGEVALPPPQPRHLAEVRGGSSRLPHPVGGPGASIFPPRGSSRATTHDFTYSLLPPPVSDPPPTTSTIRRYIDPRLSRDFRLIEEGSSSLVEVPASASATELTLTPDAADHTSQTSKQSTKESSSKGKMSLGNLRGLFRRGGQAADNNKQAKGGKGKGKEVVRRVAMPTTIETTSRSPPSAPTPLHINRGADETTPTTTAGGAPPNLGASSSGTRDVPIMPSNIVSNTSMSSNIVKTESTSRNISSTGSSSRHAHHMKQQRTPMRSALPLPISSSSSSRGVMRSPTQFGFLSPTSTSSHSPRVPGGVPPPLPGGTFSETTDLATELLASAKNETNATRRSHLVEMGRVLVNVITQARQAEQAVERAKLAATQAEVASAISRRTVFEVQKMIRDWKNEYDDEKKNDDGSDKKKDDKDDNKDDKDDNKKDDKKDG
ncbi:MAG: hypothetical protein M1823_004776 [Watsoniomyces obsoletus]|nr:MAG: hypothetical protein M1823_004776 [Watsoniomyces obsoletus]